MSEQLDDSGGVVTETRRKTRDKTRPPRMFRVLLHNDDYTTREFVIEVLCTVFHKSEAEATEIMLKVHNNGVGVAGIYPRDIAETKALTVEQIARGSGYPLRLSVEPED
jgi:ATP-dependent Clp protease adaptor protein ClpS